METTIAPLSSPPGLRRKIIFCLVATLLFFSLAEIVLRVAGFKYQVLRSGVVESQIDIQQEGMRPDPDLEWSWIPFPAAERTIKIPRLRYSFEIHFNAAGYRGQLVPVRRTKRVSRILTMGDSCTMGWGVGDDKTYTYRLHEILEKRTGRPVEVINGGVLGYTSYQGLHEFSRHMAIYHPDVLIVCYNWNDHLPALTEGSEAEGGVRPTPDKFLPKYSFPAKIAGALLVSRVSQFLEFLLLKAGVFQAINQHYMTGEPQQHGILVRVALPDFENNLTQIIDEARAEKITPILMTEASAPVINIPLKQAELKKYYGLQDFYNKAIRQTAAKEGVRVIDVVPAFKSEEDAGLFLDLVHPNVRGHALIAQEIAPVVLPLLFGSQ